jgi:hypothetical protein
MKTTLEKKYFVIPVAYAAIIALFLFLHFSDQNTFSKQIGNMTISGIVPENGNGTTNVITEATVTYNGIRFHFDKDTQITISSNNNSEKKVDLKTYTLFPDGIELRFSNNLVLRFISEGGVSNRISLYLRATSASHSITSVALPFSLTPETEVIPTGELPVLTIRANNTTSFLSITRNATIDAQSKAVRLTPEEGSFPTIVLENPPENDMNAFAYWFSKGADIESRPDYRETIENFLDKTYSGWEQRYQAGSGTWQVKNGDPVFNEKLVTAYLAEALRRDQYNAVRQNIQAALANHQEQLTLFSTPFLGNLQERSGNLQEQDLQRVNTIEDMIRNEDPAVFTEPNLIPFIVNHGPFSLVHEVYNLAEKLDIDELDTAELIGIIRIYNQLTISIPEAEKIFSQIASTVQKHLLSSIVRTEQGFFLKSNQDRVDLLLSIKAGKQLQRLGEKKNQETVVTIGKHLTASGIALCDAQGYLPATASIQSGSLTETGEERIPPETFYPAIADNPFYPQELSLYDTLGPGTWIWTIASFTEISSTSNRLSLSFSFPEGSTHHFVFQGLKPFTSVRMHGMNWRSDPTFERYSSGWVYEEETQTLYVKITHRQREERIVITF